jgi:cysteine-rich repeat protein
MHRQRKILWGLVALMTVAARPLPAQVVEVPTFEVASPTVGQFINYTDVATGPDGRVVFIWGEDVYGGGIRNAILSRQFAPDGGPLGPPVRVDASGYAFDPAISADTRGGYVAAWERANDHCTWGDPTSDMCAVIGRRLDATGRPVGGELSLDSWFGWPIAVAGLPSGSVFFWEGSSTGTSMEFRLFGPDGEILGTSTPTLVEHAVAYYADVKVLPDGDFVTTWFNDYTHTSWGRISDPAGKPRGASFLLSDRMAVSHAAASPLGGFAVVGSYTDQTNLSGWSDTNRLFARRFGDDGTPLGDEELIYEAAPNVWVVFADLDFDAQGNLFVVWTEMCPNAPCPSGSPLFSPPKARAFDANGVPFGPAVAISDISGFAASTALLANGSFVNVWEGFPALYTDGVYANIVTLCQGGANCPTPAPTWTPAPTRTPTPTPAPPRCGDGIVSSGEQCDDGNTVNGDGCDNNCTVTRCGNGIVTNGEECDDGNLVSGDGCDAYCLVEQCGDGRIEGNEQCDDGNTIDGDGCQSDCTLTPMHDSVLVPIDPIKITIPASQGVFSKVVPVQVRNADIEPKPERPGHVIQLIANDGDCPEGTIVGLPDFYRGTPGDQDSILVMGGTVKTAHVIVQVSRDAFPNLDNKVPQRCTLQFTAQTVVPGNVDPTPENNAQAVELNVVAAGAGNGTGAGSSSALIASSVVQPEFFLVSAKPVKVTLRVGRGVVQKRTDVRVTTGGAVGAAQPTQTITVVASDGDCPAGTVGVSDFDPRVEGAQNVVTLGAGKTARGKLLLTIDAASFTSANAKSPARCTALITSTADGTPGPTNHLTKLLIEVTDRNDF